MGIEDLTEFQERCVEDFKDFLQWMEIYHFKPYYKTRSSRKVLEILKNLKPMASKGEVIVDFDDDKSFDCFEDVELKEGLLHIVWRLDSPIDTLILKPKEMLIQHKHFEPRANFIFIRNYGLRNYKSKLNESKLKFLKQFTVLYKPNRNVLIHPKGSDYTDTRRACELMIQLRKEF